MIPAALLLPLKIKVLAQLLNIKQPLLQVRVLQKHLPKPTAVIIRLLQQANQQKQRLIEASSLPVLKAMCLRVPLNLLNLLLDSLIRIKQQRPILMMI